MFDVRALAGMSRISVFSRISTYSVRLQEIPYLGIPPSEKWNTLETTVKTMITVASPLGIRYLRIIRRHHTVRG